MEQNINAEKIESTPVATLSGTVRGLVARIYADMAGFSVEIVDESETPVLHYSMRTRISALAVAASVVGY